MGRCPRAGWTALSTPAAVPGAGVKLSHVPLAPLALRSLLALSVQHGTLALQAHRRVRHELAAPHRAAAAVAPLALALRLAVLPPPAVHHVGRQVDHRALAVRHLQLPLAVVCAAARL